MMLNHTKSLLVFAAASLFVASGCLKDPSNALPTIADLVVASPDFGILEDAAIQCGLVFTLSNPNAGDPSGEFTVFAPTNEAFSRLGLDNSDALTSLQTAFLTNAVLYHVSDGYLSGNDIAEDRPSASLFSVSRRFITNGPDQYINGSKILATDVQTANGTVHVIDKVLLATGLDIVQSAIALKDAQVFKVPELSFLVEAVLYAGLADALTASAGSPSFTVFAPTDAAFKQLGIDLGVPLNNPSDIRQLPKDVVTAVLLNHVVVDGGKFSPEMGGSAVVPLGGSALTISKFSNGDLVVRGKGNVESAKTVIPDVQTINGVVHLIDRVLLP